MSRTPDEIIATIDDILMGKDDHGTDVWSCIWEIIEDILNSVKLAEDSELNGELIHTIHQTVTDYVVNHYSPGG